MAHRDNISRVYKDIHEDDKSNVSLETTTGLWTGDTASLSTFHTSGTQIAKANSKYFIDVYNADPAATSSAEVQFSVGYGHVSGAGSPTLTQQNTSTLSTKAVYMQMKNLLLEPTDAKFSFVTAAHTSSGEQIYAIAFKRSRYKGYVDPGNWELKLSGSNGAFHFIDDSSQTLGTRRSFAKNGLVFNVASGSLTGTQGSTIAGITSSAVPNAGEGFGLFYPQKGIIILNADVMDSHLGMGARDDYAGDTVSRVGSIGSFFDVTCDYNDDPTIAHDARTGASLPRIRVGMGVLGTGIPVNSTVLTINGTTGFELNVSTTGGSVTNGTLEFFPINQGENTSSAAVYISQSSGVTVPQAAAARAAGVGPLGKPNAPFTASLAGDGSSNYQDQFNWHGLFQAMRLGGEFKARSAEIVSSAHYFLRLNNKEFNYSNNPSFATGSNGQLVNQDFENDPRVYVTTVGLYNDSNELLAVAKLSRPLEKSFSKEALLRVRLDF